MMIVRLYLTQIFQSFSTVVSSSIGKHCVLLQMFNKGKLDVVSLNYRNSTTKERELCTTCRPLLVIVNSKTKYEHNKIGSDLSFTVLNDHKPIFSCSAEKGNLPPKNNFCTNAIDQS